MTTGRQMTCGACGKTFTMALPYNKVEQECPCGFVNLMNGRKPKEIYVCSRCGRDCTGKSGMCAECWNLTSPFRTKEEVGRKDARRPSDASLPEEDDYDA